MLSIFLVDALTALVNHEDGVAKLDQTARKAHWQTVRAALGDAATARVAASRSAQKRHQARTDAGIPNTGGRPATVWYVVAMEGLWERRVLGAPAALEIVNQTLAENHGSGKPPTLGALAVGMSKQGAWVRHLQTDYGEFDLSVSKARDQSMPAPETGTDPAPSKKRARKLKQT